MSDKMEGMLQALRWAGYKMTEPRRRVVSSLIDNQEKHLTVEELFDDINRTHPPIGLATVYRTLNVLHELELVSKLDLGDGFDRYEVADESHHHHHHLLCRQCDAIIEVKEDYLDELEDRIQKDYGFEVTGHSVKFFGLCGKCKQESRNKL